MLTVIHTFVARRGTGALRPDELLRAEWVARVSALDLFIHELVAQRMLKIISQELPQTAAFTRFRVSTDTAARMAVGPATAAQAAFDLDLREQFSTLTFQMPDKIADAIRLCSSVKLWNAVAENQNLGAPTAQIEVFSKNIKATLSLIVGRRNKIAHEGDLQPGVPREPWPISESDVAEVRNFIQCLVISIDSVVAAADPP